MVIAEVQYIINLVTPVLEYIWFVASLVVFLVWLRRSRWGQAAFAQAPRRRHQIAVTDVLLVGLFYIGTTLAAVAVTGKEGEPSWEKRDSAGLILAGGWLVTAGVIVLVGSRRFSGGMRGFGIWAGRGVKMPRLIFIYSLVVFGLTFLALMITLQVCQAFGYDKVQKHDFLNLLEQRPPLFSMILLLVSPVLVAPLVEELLFRGMLQNFFIGLLAREAGAQGEQESNGAKEPVTAKSRWVGIIIAGILFALLHADWQHWPALLVLGVGLGYCYERYGNLLVPIAMHSLFNILPLTVTMMHLTKSG